LSKILEGEVI